MNPIKVLTF